MSRKKPNIITPYNNKGVVRDLIENVFKDSFVSAHTPDSINLNGTLFTLILLNKKFTYEEVKVDVSSDYVDIYLQTIKQKVVIVVVIFGLKILNIKENIIIVGLAKQPIHLNLLLLEKLRI
mgnify:CR=1 FL=1